MANSKTSHASELIRITRTIAKLQRDQRKYRRYLKEIKGLLKLERRHMKALVTQMSNPSPDDPPMRLFGEAATISHIDKVVGHLR